MQQQLGTSNEEFIATIDLWNLGQVRWPVLRALCRTYVEQRELRQFEHQLLATRRWNMVRCIPQTDPASADGAAAHVFNVYGIASGAD
jgi:hypothetical protein